METIALSEAAHYVSQSVRIKGHLQSMRDLGQIIFVNVRDRSGSIQVVVVGDARYPGTYTISSLSTLVNAVFASGGPAPQGAPERRRSRALA